MERAGADVGLAGATNAGYARSQATGTIVNDDSARHAPRERRRGRRAWRAPGCDRRGRAGRSKGVWYPALMATPIHRYSFADYIAFEEAGTTKHEFLDGEIYGMAGGTPEHAALSVAVSSTLLAQLRGGPCRVYSSDLRVRALATGLATYPDVTVVCGEVERDPQSATTVVNPRVVVEVLSDATEAYDRGQKLDHYRRIPSLAAVVLVSHRAPLIEVWARAADGSFRREESGPGQTARIEALPATLAVDEVYQGFRP